MKTGPINATTREFTGLKTFKANTNRAYFFITFTAGNGTIRFGEEGGEIPIVQGGHYAPPIAPSTTITITTTGTYVVHTNIF